MVRIFFLLIFVLFTTSIIQCDLTNLNDFLSKLKENTSINYPIGFLSQANLEVVKRYLPGNIVPKFFNDRHEMLNAIDNETIIAGVTTGQSAQDLEPQYHVFSSLIVSPQAMLLAPNYDNVNNDLFDALNAAIADVQRDGTDEKLLANTNHTDSMRVYTCHQNSQLPVANRSEATGYLNDILTNKTPLKIGGWGPQDWGVHDGNYKLNTPNGFYPLLLDAIVKKLRQLKGADDVPYGEGIKYEWKFYPNMTALFRALLDGEVHATDVYVLIEVPYNGTGESCSNDSSCRPKETCVNNRCTYPERPRSLHFRTTCTTASRDTKYVTKKPKESTTNGTRETPKTRWIGFILIFVVLFGAIFLTLLVFTRRKKTYRVEHTLQGGIGKFARLQEEAELPIEGMDAFDDHIVQSPRDNINSTT